MGRRNNIHKTARRRCSSFAFLDLPLDLQLHTFGFFDLQTLYSATCASSHLRSLYIQYSNGVLRRVTNNMGMQIQNLMLTTFDAIRIMQSPGTRPEIDFTSLGNYLTQNLDTEEPREILTTEDDAFLALSDLVGLESEIATLVQRYSKDTHARACFHDNPGAILPPLNLSRTECHRIARGFWRLKLFGVLFYNYADCFDLELSNNSNFLDSRSNFLDRLSAFEMDEMVTVYQYMVSHRLYFTSAFPHENCPYAGKPQFRNRDPFECPDCQGRYLHPHLQYRDTCCRNQAFWHIIEAKYVESHANLWANHNICRALPIKMWDDFPESNKYNAGWEHCEYTKTQGLDGGDYIVSFRCSGYCFWDQERLEEWDFFQSWASEYEAAGIDW